MPSEKKELGKFKRVQATLRLRYSIHRMLRRLCRDMKAPQWKVCEILVEREFQRLHPEEYAREQKERAS